jgi:hypothetical protein
MIVGPPDTPGEESFDITVCTPEWLGERCRADGGIYSPRHHLVVTMEEFDKRSLRAWLEARVRDVEAPTWLDIGERLGRLAYWEFEDYTPWPSVRTSPRPRGSRHVRTSDQPTDSTWK